MEVRLYYESLLYKTFEKVQKITFIDILGEYLFSRYQINFIYQI